MAEVSQIESRDSEYKGINLHPYFSWHFTDTYNATSNPTAYWSNAPFSEFGTALSDGWCHFEIDNRAGTATARSDFAVRNLGNTINGSLYTVMLEFKNVNINKDGDNFYTVQGGQDVQVWGASATEPNETYGGFTISNATLRQLPNGQGVFYKNVLANNNVKSNQIYFMQLTWNVSKGQKVSADIRISVYEGANYRGPYVPFDPNTPVNPNFLKSIRTLNVDKVPNLLSDGTFGTALGTYWINTGLTASISNNSLIIDGSSVPSGDHRIYQNNGYFVHQVGRMYTLSCDIVATQNCQISFGRKFRTSTDEIIDDYGVTFDVTTTEQHLSGSYIATKSAYQTFQISEVSNSAMVTIKNIRLEVTDNPNLLGSTLDPAPNFKNTTSSDYPCWYIGSGGNGVGTIATIEDSPVSTFDKVFRLTGNTSGNRDFQQKLNSYLEVGKQYIFSAYAKAINATQCTARIRFYANGDIFVYSQTITQEWTKIYIVMNTNTWDGSTTIRLLMGLTGAGSIEYIAPTLTRLEPTDQRIHRNLIWDTQWKKLDSDSWYPWGSPTTREIVEIDGKRWLHLVTTTTAYQGWQQDATRRSGFGTHYVQELIPGEKYTVSFDAYASEATTVTNIVGFHWKDKRGTILSQSWSSANLTTTSQRFNFQYTVPANATTFNVMIGDSSTTAHELWISNLFFTKGANSANYNKRYQPAPEDCDEAVAGYEESNPNLYVIKRAHDGYIDYATGYIDPMDNVNAEETSDFIPVTAGEHIYFQAWSRVTDATNHWIGYGLYNSNKQFISRTAKYDGIKDINGFIYNYFDITIPSGTAYIRCSYRRNREGYAKVERGNLPTNWTPALEDISINSCPRNLLPQSHMMKSFDCNQTEYTSYKTPQLTANADGWIHVSYDNSANTSNQDLYWMPPILNEIVPGRPYTILIEIKNFTSTQPYNATTFSYMQQENGKQFWGGEGYYGNAPVGVKSNNTATYISGSDVENIENGMYRIIKKAEDNPSRMTNPQKYLFRWRNYIRPQSVASFDVRFSIYEGFYWGTYKPCLEYHNYDLRDDYSTWGGRNLAWGSRTLSTAPSSTTCFIGKYGGNTSVIENYYGKFNAVKTYDAQWAGIGISLRNFSFDIGEEITASSYIDVSGDSVILCWYLMCFNSSGTRVYPENTSLSAQMYTLTNKTYYRMVKTFVWTQELQNLLNAGGYITFTFQTQYKSSDAHTFEAYFYSPKLERGNKVTDWSPAPEDMMRYISDETIELYSE